MARAKYTNEALNQPDIMNGEESDLISLLKPLHYIARMANHNSVLYLGLDGGIIHKTSFHGSAENRLRRNTFELHNKNSSSIDKVIEVLDKFYEGSKAGYKKIKSSDHYIIPESP